ncbi:hypothetical protein ABBQ32_013560 [Trebouxia sp. C0010 RCD-2024]
MDKYTYSVCPLQGCVPEGGLFQNKPEDLGRAGRRQHRHEVQWRPGLLAGSITVTSYALEPTADELLTAHITLAYTH